MRIYNGTDSQVDLPLAGSQRITIAPKAISGDIMSSTELLSLLVTSYRTDELALVISGPFEINLCATIPATTEYVVQSLDEAIARFNPVKKEEEKPVVVEDEEVKPTEEEPKAEEEVFPVDLPEKPVEEEEAKDEGEIRPEVEIKAPKRKKKGDKK